MANINLELGAFGLNVTNYTLRHKLFGTATFATNNTTPGNPITATNLTPQITGVIENTIYDIQIASNCGASTAQSPTVQMIVRGCPTLAQHNINATDSTITASFPLSTPAPISSHITNIVVELFQGATLVSTQTLTSLNTTNTVTFTGLNQNTTYDIRYSVNYAASDSYPLASYPNGGDANTQVCLVSAQTTVTPVCPAAVILTITES
jgi:hypothetical protein